jgi:hypothetical protein
MTYSPSDGTARLSFRGRGLSRHGAFVQEQGLRMDNMLVHRLSRAGRIAIGKSGENGGVVSQCPLPRRRPGGLLHEPLKDR